MRRFTVIIFVLAAAAYFLPPAKIPHHHQQAADAFLADGHSRQNETVRSKNAALASVSAEEWRSQVVAEYIAIEKEMPDPPSAVELGGVPLPVKPRRVVAADQEKIAPSHIPSSAAADEVGPELKKLSLFDLKSKAQEELARLDCYGARVDGLWGPKSRAAVQKFNKAMGASLDNSPTAELVQALRSAPSRICSRSCASNMEGESCSVASTEQNGSEENAEDAAPYLPPWMKEQDIASTDPEAGIEDAGQTEEAGAPGRREKRRRVERRAQRRQAAQEQRYRRHRQVERRRQHQSWKNLSGWPGTDR